MVFPKNPHESQTLLAATPEELRERLGESGTVVFMPECDRLTYRKAQTLADHATKEMARIYRRFIAKGLRLFVNNRRVEAFDPTYWMASARHIQIQGLSPTQSKLVGSWPISVPVSESSTETTTINVRLYALPYEQWSHLPRKVLKNDLRLCGWLVIDRSTSHSLSHSINFPLSPGNSICRCTHNGALPFESKRS